MTQRSASEPAMLSITELRVVFNPPPDRCRDCGATEKLSRRFLCQACGVKRFLACIHQMHEKTGPYYDRWLQGMQAAIDKLQA